MTERVLTREEKMADQRSLESGISFEVKKDSKGKVLNPEVLSRTVQSEKDSCDINLIVASALKNGGLVLSPEEINQRVYSDVSNIGDWREIKTRVASAQQAFALLPANLRNKFNNSVEELFAFLADSKNDKEAVELKLKPYEVLLTAFADDGTTRITADERARLDAIKAAGGNPPAAGASGTGT